MIAAFRRAQATARAATRAHEVLFAEGETQDQAREAGHTHAVQHPLASAAAVAEAKATAQRRALDLAPLRPANSKASAPTHLPFPAPGLGLLHPAVAAAALHPQGLAPHRQNPNLHAVDAAQQVLRLAPHLRVVEDTRHLLPDRRLHLQGAGAILAVRLPGGDVRRPVRHRHPRGRGRRERRVRVRRRDRRGILVAPRQGGGISCGLGGLGSAMHCLRRDSKV